MPPVPSLGVTLLSLQCSAVQSRFSLPFLSAVPQLKSGIFCLDIFLLGRYELSRARTTHTLNRLSSRDRPIECVCAKILTRQRKKILSSSFYKCDGDDSDATVTPRRRPPHEETK
jgi:hypothetical protein